MSPDPAATFRLRLATAADNELLAQLGAETFFDTFAADNTPENMAAYLAASFSPEKQAQELADPATRVLILEAHDAPAGYTRLRFGPAPEMIAGRQPVEIVRFYARRPWIGRGVGARLMQACLAEAAQAGCDTIWLDVWERNPRAIAFYERWGFQRIGRQVFQLGDDRQTDWLMARPVAAG